MNITEKIFSCPSVAGGSEKMASLLKEQLEQTGCKCREDVLGSVFFTKEFSQNGKNVMLCTGIDMGGVVATYVEKSKIYVGALGGADVQRLAFSKVVFEGISGVLVPPEGYSASTPVSDCYVETEDDDADKKVTLGDKGSFDTRIHAIKDGVYSGYDIGRRACIVKMLDAAKKLFSPQWEKTAEAMEIASVTVAFLGQSSLSSRGAFVAGFGVKWDEIILLSPMDCKKCGTDCTKETSFVVKMLDKAWVCDMELTKSICKYFDDNGKKYKTSVNSDTDPALTALSRSSSCPRCAQICLPVFKGDIVYLN